uniref:uncharacterized protein LOC127068181 isoform X3 n=1 Tax=Vespula vulgaris TaxID=7454 RepID=UPI00223C2E56|nr:uncharacterized protein LOC127068181 isoform X3 [Vespula vulgaris]
MLTRLINMIRSRSSYKRRVRASCLCSSEHSTWIRTCDSSSSTKVPLECGSEWAEEFLKSNNDRSRYLSNFFIDFTEQLHQIRNSLKSSIDGPSMIFTTTGVIYKKPHDLAE